MLVWAASCGILVEIDISDKELTLIAPSDGVTVEGEDVTFQWDWIEGASEYRVTVVSPTFDQIERVEVDTTLSGERTTTLTAFLEEDDYQWRVEAKNSEYETTSEVRSFVLVEDLTVPSIKNEVISAISPQHGGTTTDLDISFRWSQVPDASGYILSIYRDGVNDPAEVNDQALENNKFSWTFQAPENELQKYRWTVRAVNSRDETIDFEFDFTIKKATSTE